MLGGVNIKPRLFISQHFSAKLLQFFKNVYNLSIDKIIIKMAKKRIYNPKTRTYYKIRERTTEYGQKGEILGKWSPKKQRKKKKGFFEELFDW